MVQAGLAIHTRYISDGILKIDRTTMNKPLGVSNSATDLKPFRNVQVRIRTQWTHLQSHSSGASLCFMKYLTYWRLKFRYKVQDCKRMSCWLLDTMSNGNIRNLHVTIIVLSWRACSSIFRWKEQVGYKWMWMTLVKTCNSLHLSYQNNWKLHVISPITRWTICRKVFDIVTDVEFAPFLRN